MLLDRDRGIAYREKRMDSPRESVSPRAESRSTRTLWLDWLTRQQSVAQLLGYSFLAVDGPTGLLYVSRLIPQPHPDWPNFPFYASEASELIGELPRGRSPGDVGSFDEARTTLTYTSRKYQVRTDAETQALLPAGVGINQIEAFFLRYVEINERPASGYQTLPPNCALVWASDGAPASMMNFVITHHTMITVIWREVPLEAYREYQVGASAGF